MRAWNPIIFWYKNKKIPRGRAGAHASWFVCFAELTEPTVGNWLPTRRTVGMKNLQIWNPETDRTPNTRDGAAADVALGMQEPLDGFRPMRRPGLSEHFGIAGDSDGKIIRRFKEASPIGLDLIGSYIECKISCPVPQALMEAANSYSFQYSSSRPNLALHRSFQEPTKR